MSKTSESQMTYRYLRRRKKHILLLIGCVVFLLFWFNVVFTRFQETLETCPYPCIFSKFINSDSSSATINLYEILNLRKAPNSQQGENVDDFDLSKDHICHRPNFDLKHDSVKYAFFPMEKLNCTGTSLFTVRQGVFRINKSLLLKDRELEKCVYVGIERVNDDFSTYTEPLSKEEGPFDLRIEQDFVRIKCFYKEQDTDDKRENRRKLLALSNQLIYKTTSGSQKSVREFDSHQFVQSEIFQSRKLKDVDGSTDVQSDLKDVNQDTEKQENNLGNDQYYGPDHNYDDYFRAGYMDYLMAEGGADFDQFLVQVSPKLDVFTRINSMKSHPESSGMNVIMFGLDSMSHLAYQRKLPLTYQYLRDELESVVMEGYNIVGDATTAALIPMLTGKTETELPDVRKSELESKTVDVYPLIWKDFRRHGYVTLLAEDEPSISAFNLRLNGFRDQPTDHYMRPFWQSLWESDLRKNSPRYCTGSKPNHMFMIDYLKDFMEKYNNVSKFAFVFGSELTHWDNNPGQYIDNDLLEFLKFLKQNGHLKNTVLIIMADHGARYSRVRKTVQGKMEERLPMMSLLFPPWFFKKYPHLHKNLKDNADKLTTPFDIYETLQDVLNISRTLEQPHKESRGRSLLLPIPQNRTCSDAGVQMHWCTCLKQLALDIKDTRVIHSALALVEYINRQTERAGGLCVMLTLKKIHSAYLLVPNEQVLKFQKAKDSDGREANFSSKVQIDHAHFQVTIETVPNKGTFEGTVQVNMTGNTYMVMEGVSRLDLYGKQPACIQEKYPDLRKFCFCRIVVNRKQNG